MLSLTACQSTFAHHHSLVSQTIEFHHFNMPLAIPPELKKVTPYVRRAEELDKDKSNAESRLVAYYCRQYAVHTGIDLATSAAGKTCLGDLLSSLEEEKVAMNSFTRDEAKFLCQKFANKIFDKADLEDRTGGSTKNTARTFYAAASFLEILNQFYKNDEGSEELAEIKKRAVYGKWKATEILKAIKEGREPTPGGYGEDLATAEDEAEFAATEASTVDSGPKVETVEDEDEDEKKAEDDGGTEPEGPVVRMPSEEQNDNGEDDTAEVSKKEEEENDEGTEVELGPPPPSYDFAPPPVAPPKVARPPVTFPPPAPAPAPAMSPPPTTKPNPPPPVEKTEKKSGGGIFGFGKKKKSKLSKAELADAMELTRFALAALEEKDSDLAAERLKQALNTLGR
jgi:vacuolar protein sorting-associated protein VTA1